MNLLKPGRGDMLDRLTILARKIVERPERKDFTEEFDALLVAGDQGGKSMDVAVEYVVELAALNAAIWQREDEIRKWRDSPISDGREDFKVVKIAFEIQDLNDRRAALIAEINGTESEKLYK